jgi:hypothetical protein
MWARIRKRRSTISGVARFSIICSVHCCTQQLRCILVDPSRRLLQVYHTTIILFRYARIDASAKELLDVSVRLWGEGISASCPFLRPNLRDPSTASNGLRQTYTVASSNPAGQAARLLQEAGDSRIRRSGNPVDVLPCSTYIGTVQACFEASHTATRAPRRYVVLCRKYYAYCTVPRDTALQPRSLLASY